MRGGASIFVWEVRCKSSRTFSLCLTDLWLGDFSSFLQPSTQTSSIFLACEFLHPLSSGSWELLVVAGNFWTSKNHEWFLEKFSRKRQPRVTRGRKGHRN
ncbi:hypothetical protein L3X38_019382 [Prunus dulcis]|uniref:Uncharacterized protein n=1 Tax=Prunus dulcis TaxID=3755 RepID=A0AAD4WBS5_PRUDU|nr:hypothetical protein L3X38_019382 [Prunus dulcis]